MKADAGHRIDLQTVVMGVQFRQRCKAEELFVTAPEFLSTSDLKVRLDHVIGNTRPEPGATDAGKKNGVWQEVGHFDSCFRAEVTKAIEALSTLKQNWDSYGAPPIDPNIVSAALKFVRLLPENIASRPRVVPMSPGNLQLEWHHGRKILELEFETPATIHFLKWDADKDFSEEDTFRVNEIDRAVDLIQWFMSGASL